ncbi:hypothetical protein J7E81_20740 [Bacillus sp. ISL-18]|uniref:hypothetical protein n=1 Tax=Bacillus sp. ISL-18 TaxID=2819118 RepID=UPI001BEC6188|nr:hypothetical protein [Bacillus sp. ISL-18]MBT2657629.1 hypothetical protein [Bacillus sp. ISL-18]
MMQIIGIVATLVSIVTGVAAIAKGTYKFFKKRDEQKKLAIVKAQKTAQAETDTALRIKMLMQSSEIIDVPTISMIPLLGKDDSEFGYLSSDNISEWRTNLRRKLICPFWATNLSSNELGLVKRVMPLTNESDMLTLQVTIKEENVVWDVKDTYPADRLSNNALLLQHYRTKFLFEDEERIV